MTTQQNDDDTKGKQSDEGELTAEVRRVLRRIAGVKAQLDQVRVEGAAYYDGSAAVTGFSRDDTAPDPRVVEASRMLAEAMAHLEGSFDLPSHEERERLHRAEMEERFTDKHAHALATVDNRHPVLKEADAWTREQELRIKALEAQIDMHGTAAAGNRANLERLPKEDEQRDAWLADVVNVQHHRAAIEADSKQRTALNERELTAFEAIAKHLGTIAEKVARP